MGALQRWRPASQWPEVWRELGVSVATFYTRRARIGDMDTSLMACMKEFAEENRRLKTMHVDEIVIAGIVAEALAKSGAAIPPACDGKT